MPNVADFQPDFASRLASFRDALTQAGITNSIESGYRSPEYQDQMYQNHLAKAAKQPLPYPNVEAPSVVAPAWKSFHNFGLAADFHLGSQADYARMAAMAPQFGLTGIGDSDPGHIQMSGSLASNVSQYKLAGWRPTSSPAPANGSIAYSGPGGGTTIDASNPPVKGALAETGPESAGQGAPTAAQPGQPMDVRQLVFNKLTGAGLAPHQALGAIWGLNGESRGLDPNAYNPKDPGGSVGFGQWMGPRRAALEAFAKNRGTAVTDPNTQADFLVDELTNKDAATYQPGVLAKMQGATTAEDATKIWTSQFERPKVDNSDARIKTGPQAASLDANGNFVLGPGVGANAPSTTAAPAVASGAPAADQSWWGKISGTPVDAQGKPTGEQSPLQQLTQGALGKLASEGQTPQQEAPQGGSPASEQYSVQRFAPGARNTSPMGGALLPSVPQTYGQTLNSFNAPLTWNSAPPGAPRTAPAGQQPTPGAQTPGISLTSLGALPGLGLGAVDPNLGYGFG